MERKGHLKWNRELRRLMMRLCVIIAAGMAVVNIGIGVYSEEMRMGHKAFLTAIFGNIAAVYPDVEEQEIVRVLSGKGNEELGAELLARYGVFEEYGRESFFLWEGQLRFLSVFSNALFLLFSLIGGAVLLRYLSGRQQRISVLEAYMEALQRDGYRLELQDNADDELSELRNEIYKLTVFLKEQAVRASGQKKALADSMADISHQLKTPLTSMTVLMDNLSDDIDMDPITRRHFMSEITYQLTSMSWLIAAMLKISRLDAGVVEMERESLGMAELVRESLQKVEVAAEWSQISFTLDIPEEARLVADRKWTAEALSNLVKNAVEHSPMGSSVIISAEENEVYTEISVRDQGEGIPEEERKRLFDRFYRGASAREDSAGIGLALAKEIIEKQGGHVSLESERGKGTRFVVRFLK